MESYLDLHFICSLDPVLASEMSIISEIRSKYTASNKDFSSSLLDSASPDCCRKYGVCTYIQVQAQGGWRNRVRQVCTSLLPGWLKTCGDAPQQRGRQPSMARSPHPSAIRPCYGFTYAGAGQAGSVGDLEKNRKHICIVQI